MSKVVLLFAGTIEGRYIAKQLLEEGVCVHVCVTTEYGKSLYEKQPLLTVSDEPLNMEQMQQLMKTLHPETVVDATHPYAVEATKNIKQACEESQIPYVRLLRATQRVDKDLQVEYVDTLQEAVDYVSKWEGRVLLTTGSKELAAFTAVPNYKERLYARVLSVPKVVETCTALGFEGAHLIAMQGPFTVLMNQALMEQIQANLLVTKDTGKQGGFLEKIQGAQNCHAKVLVIGRPTRETGLDFKACMEHLGNVFDFTWQPKQEITLVGIGMGNMESRTLEAEQVLGKAQLIIGAGRMLEAVAREGQDTYEAYDPKEIASYIEEHPQYEYIVIALSGDIGFYSGAKRLLEHLPETTKVVNGISSLVYFCGKIKKSWEEVHPVTMHGRQANLPGLLRKYGKLFVLIGQQQGIAEACKNLTEYGYGSAYAAIGEELAYDTEQIHVGTVADFQQLQTSKLSVLYLEYQEGMDGKVTDYIDDDEFVRGQVPMTKSEVRSLSLAKLRLTQHAVLYDIGAGTGSISIEAARAAVEGQVYAIEKKPEAVQLIKANKQKFAVENLTVVEGSAPEALQGLPTPTHGFIGGSSGNLKEILQLLLDKNPSITIVINAITLETVAEVLQCMKQLPLGQVDISQISVAKAKQAGPYHLMNGTNPVYVISCRGEQK